MTGAAVPRSPLGRDHQVPRVINGCWQLAADHRPNQRGRADTLVELLRLAERGFTAFDGADIYTGVEELLGELRATWIETGGEPGALSLHTKLVPDLDALAAVDRRYVEAIVDRSRRRLGVVALDLVQLHWWRFSVPGWVDAARWLDELASQGLVRRIGVTNFDAEHLAPILEAGVPIVSNQVQYSLLDRRPERGTAAFCRRHGIGLLAYGALAGGFLSDRWRGAPDPGWQPGNRSLTKYRLIIEELGGWAAFQELLEVIGGVAHRHAVPIAAVALRWILDQPGVAAVLLGTTGSAHLDDTLASLALRLDDQDRSRIGEVLARRPGPPGDVYSVERQPGRHAAIMKTDLNRASG